jgi:3-oxosteroid 1-dehydrogenase
MMTQTNTEHWAQAVDLLVVGSGAGAMTAAICAHDLGARTLLIEKTGQYGGSSAMSGGSLWIPNNHYMAAAGITDTPEEALSYLKGVTRGTVPEEKLRAYVESAPEMLRYLTEHTRLRMQAMLTYTDYYPEVPGGKPGARSIEAEHFDARLLGDEFERMREPAVQELVMGRMSMTATEAHHLLARHPGWIGLTARIMGRYWTDVAGRLASKRDRCLSLGNALVGMLRRSLMDRGIPLWLDTAARELVVESGRVVGVVAERNGTRCRLRGDTAVVLAAGGFESSDQMRKQYLPNPTKAEWTAGNPGNTGDAIRMAMSLGAGIDLMDEAWWGPTTVVPGEARARMLVIEKGLPGCILVNQRGARFVNEASPYIDIVHAQYAADRPEARSVPAYMIFDGTYRRKYPFGPFFQASQQPDWMLPKALRGYLKKSNTVEGLAAALGVDAAGLRATIQKMNEYARAGRDPEFRRGESLFDRYYGDEKVKPNPCLAPLDEPPFYGIETYPGDLGTKGGLKTDVEARVLTEEGKVIPGLYAIGNCAASVMGPTYPGAGGTMGPAMTFAYIVARNLFAAERAAERRVS